VSRGEAQRIKIATGLGKLQAHGVHPGRADHGAAPRGYLVDAGHTVLLIEHHLDVIKTADHVIRRAGTPAAKWW